jgi:hypothetical protein
MDEIVARRDGDNADGALKGGFYGVWVWNGTWTRVVVWYACIMIDGQR